MSTEHNTENLGGKDGGAYDKAGSAAHYKNDAIEYTDMIEELCGTAFAKHMCNAQVIKYRMRAGKKEGVTAEKDLVKANYYAKLVEFYNDKIQYFQGKIFSDEVMAKYKFQTEDELTLRFMYKPITTSVLKDFAEPDLHRLFKDLCIPKDLAFFPFQPNDKLIEILTSKA